MYQRFSVTDHVHVNAVLFSSVFEIGDSHHMDLKSQVLAVQREQQLFLGREGPFAYPLFLRKLPPPPQIRKPALQALQVYEDPVIRVGNIKIKGISTSSSLHIGSTCWIQAEARVKHIRQLAPRSDLEKL